MPTRKPSSAQAAQAERLKPLIRDMRARHTPRTAGPAKDTAGFRIIEDPSLTELDRRTDLSRAQRTIQTVDVTASADLTGVDPVTRTVYLVSAAAAPVAPTGFKDWFTVYRPDLLCSAMYARAGISWFCMKFSDRHSLEDRLGGPALLAASPVDIWYAPEQDLFWTLESTVAEHLARRLSP